MDFDEWQQIESRRLWFWDPHELMCQTETRIRALHACRLLADLFTDSGGKRRQNAENRNRNRASLVFSMGKT
jgi:hypothetical protein